MSDCEIISGVMAVIAWSFIVAIFSYLGGKSDQNEESQDEAVKAGKAEYFLNSDNEREWRWKP